MNHERPSGKQADQPRFPAAVCIDIGIDHRITGYRRYCTGADQTGLSSPAAIDAETAVQYTG